MTDDRLTELEGLVKVLGTCPHHGARCAWGVAFWQDGSAGTDGPKVWEIVHHDADSSEDLSEEYDLFSAPSEALCRSIAAMRTAVPELIEEVKRLRTTLWRG